jgi:hypothetical protein
VSEHLSVHGRLDQGEGSIVSGVQTKLEPLLLGHLGIWCIKSHKKNIRIEKVMAPKVERSRTQKNKSSQQNQFLNTQKNFLYVALLLVEFHDDL